LNQSNKLVVALIAICAAIWIIAAINPLDRQAWVLENILLVVFVGGLALTHRRLQLSNASWILLAAFAILHTIGTHYTYEKMPLGIRAKDFFHLSRNHYDRFCPRCVWNSTGVSDSGIAFAVQRNSARSLEFRVTGGDHSRSHRLF